MKTTFTVVITVAALALGWLYLAQARKGSEQQAQISALSAEAEQKSAEVAELQAAQKQSAQKRLESLRQAEELAAQLQARQAAATNLIAPSPSPADPPPAPGGEKPNEEQGFGKMVSKMMQDPEMRGFIRNQQRVMMDQLYSPLVKRMSLTPEEADKFKDLLADNMMNAAGKASSMFGGLASSNRTEVISNLTAEQKSFDEQVKTFLGDDRYAQYKDYQETVGERMQLNAYKQQAGSDYSLNEQQTEALLTFMKEERKNVAATTGLPMGADNKDPAQMQALLSGEKVDEILQAQGTLNQRVYERARTILSPEQLGSLGAFQTNQLQMMRMGMGMMKKMFGPDKPPAVSPSL